MVSSILVIFSGTFHAEEVALTQPTKFAAMEAVWDTQKNAPYNLLVIPDPANEKNSVEAIGIPNLLSLMAFHRADAEIKGLKEFPKEERPPMLPVFFSFRAMAGLGFIFLLLALIAFVVSRKDRLEFNPGLLRILLYMIPLPYLANQIGWIVAEVGRQPWIVYGLLKTSDAVSKSISMSQVVASLLGFTLVYGLLGTIDIYLLTKYARKGPDNDLSGIIKTERI